MGAPPTRQQDPSALEQALASARAWYAQLKSGDDPGDADEVMRLAEERLPEVRARALRICNDFSLAPGTFEIPVWDVIISWRDLSWVLDHPELPQR
jgi:hypothetical protein